MPRSDAKPKRILITGGTGFLGVNLAKKILAETKQVEIILNDLNYHPRVDAIQNQVSFVQGDLAKESFCKEVIHSEIDTVYHLASLVSGGAERDFEAGLKANLMAPLYLLEACRQANNRPRFIFPSSIATFGGSHMPSHINDLTHQHPQNSYGTHKVVMEHLISDYSRKGFLDGRGLRLAAIVVRDEPNTAASGYASGLIREILMGRDYTCPVSPETRLPILSLNKCIDCLIAVGTIDEALLGDFRSVNSPSINPSAQEIAAAVEKFSSGISKGRLRFEAQSEVMQIVTTWPKSMDFERAKKMGLQADESIDSIISEYWLENKPD